MLKGNLEELINDQMNFERYSGYVYLSMAAYADARGLSGIANWLKVQNEEELFHAAKMYNYLLQKGCRPLWNEMPKPPQDWESFLAVFQDTLKHEQTVTERINTIVDTAIKENDHATRAFYDWFVNEQVEEEANAQELIDKFTLIKEDSQALLMIDKELATRTFTPPAAA